MRNGLIVTVVCLGLIFSVALVQGAPEKTISRDTRCAVCGMFVGKYGNWVTQIRLADSRSLFFDGVKDLMVFYHNPQKYGNVAAKDIKEVWVRDYYSQEWIDGLKAFYVVGSDVLGPMGKEFIPFADKSAAETFLKDHNGRRILTFDEITDDLVQSMRMKMKMKHGGAMK
ncbi:MAG TPA: NosL family protein [Desulfobulbus sp.]|nr:NosL family protein [Desulfobulbus sp.]